MDESDEAILAAATNLDGTRRFYPPYEHPATAQLGEYITRLETLPESDEREQALEHARQQMARFEYGEDRAKRDYLRTRHAASPETDGEK
jgi:hypothetical protein